MPTNHTEWMLAESVSIVGTARPGQFTDDNDYHNVRPAVRIFRNSGIGSLVIEGKPEHLMNLAQQLTDAAALIVVQVESNPQLRELFGRQS